MKRFPGVAFLTVQPTNEFNIAALFTESGRRHLLNLALSGNDSVMTPFVPPDGLRAGARAEAQRRRDDNFQMMARMALASQERIERFHVELAELEDRRLALLARTEAELREAQDRLRQLRDAAPEIELPDGTRRKVFRDGNDVRDEAGTLVRPEIINAEAVSNDPLHRKKYLSAKDVHSRLVERRDRLHQFGEQIKDAGQQADDGKMSGKDMDEFKADLEKALAAEESPIAAMRAATPAARERTFGTAVTPTVDFTLAAPGNMPDTLPREPDNKIKPLSPDVSAPAPM